MSDTETVCRQHGKHGEWRPELQPTTWVRYMLSNLFSYTKMKS